MDILVKNSAALGPIAWDADKGVHNLDYDFASSLHAVLPDTVEPLGIQLCSALMDYYGERFNEVTETAQKMHALGVPNGLSIAGNTATIGYSRTINVYIRLDYLAYTTTRYQFTLRFGGFDHLTQLLDALGLEPWVGLLLPAEALTIFARPSHINERYLNTLDYNSTAVSHQQVLAPEMQTWVDDVARQMETWVMADKMLTKHANTARNFRTVERNGVVHKPTDSNSIYQAKRATLLDALVPARQRIVRPYRLVESVDRMFPAGIRNALITMCDKTAMYDKLNYKEQAEFRLHISDCRLMTGKPNDTAHRYTSEYLASQRT